MVEDSGKERRASGRFNTAAFIWYAVIGATKTDEGEGETEDGNLATCVDLSATGVGFLSIRPMASGVRIFLVVAIRGGELAAVGRVAHSRPLDDGRFRIGVRFEIIPPTHRPTLERLVKK